MFSLSRVRGVIAICRNSAIGMQGVSGSLSVAVRWASKKAGGSSRNCLKKPAGKRLGLKCGDGEHVIPGNIIVKQRGTVFHPGANVGMSRDHSLYSLVEGHVQFSREARQPLPPQKGRQWVRKPWRKYVNVVELPQTHRLVLTEPQLTGYKHNMY